MIKTKRFYSEEDFNKFVEEKKDLIKILNITHLVKKYEIPSKYNEFGMVEEYREASGIVTILDYDEVLNNEK